MKHSSHTFSGHMYRLLAIATLGVLLAGCSANSVTGTTHETSSEPVAMNSSDASISVSVPTSTYTDGTYSAQGKYTSPAGPETEDVTITLRGNVITDATFKGNAVGTRSREYQKKFSEGFKEAVIGKPIDQLSLTVVNGSSLTPAGFMNAVENIKAQAKA